MEIPPALWSLMFNYEKSNRLILMIHQCWCCIAHYKVTIIIKNTVNIILRNTKDTDLNLHIGFFFSPNTAMISASSHRAGMTLNKREKEKGILIVHCTQTTVNSITFNACHSLWFRTIRWLMVQKRMRSCDQHRLIRMSGVQSVQLHLMYKK